MISFNCQKHNPAGSVIQPKTQHPTFFSGLDRSLTKLRGLQAALDNLHARLAGLSTGPGLKRAKAVSCAERRPSRRVARNRDCSRRSGDQKTS